MYNGSKFKNYTIKLNNTNDGFYIYIFAQDTQKVYSCNVTRVKFEQRTTIHLFDDTLSLNSGYYSYYYDLMQYFSQTPHLNFSNPYYFDWRSTRVLLLDSISHLILNHLDIKRDTAGNIHFSVLSPNGRYLYVLEGRYAPKPLINIYLRLRKIDFYDAVNYVPKEYILYDSLIDIPHDKFNSPTWLSDYSLIYGPCSRIFMLNHGINTFVINKPDMPFGYEKFYKDFQVVETPDSNIINKYYFHLNGYANVYPLKQNLYLNTTEQYSCNVVMLHVDADTAYKNFVWYVYNKQTNQFDSSTGNNCYIKDVSGGIYCKLKGITNSGYFAWYSDSLYPHLKLKAIIASTNKLGCQYVAYQFKDSSIITEINPSYKQYWHWYFGDGTDAMLVDTGSYSNYGKGNISHIYTKNGIYSVKLIYNNGYCEDAFNYINAVNIVPAPAPLFTVNYAYSCPPFLLQLYDTSTLAISRYYTFGDGKDTVANAFNNNFQASHLYNKTGVYTITQSLTGSTGCVTTSNQNIEVVPPFKISLGNDSTICFGESMILSSTMNHANYIWNNGSTDSVFNITQEGQYILTANVGACKSTDSIIVTYYKDGECDNHILAYPNPFAEELFLKGFLKNQNELTIKIIDLSGRLVASYQPTPQQGHFTLKIPSATFAAGMYIIDIISNDLNKRLKVVKF